MNEISTVRAWISKQRIDIANQIAALRGKLAVFDQLERELLGHTPQAVTERSDKRVLRGSKVQTQAMLALEAAGRKGLTSKEVADVAQIPYGSASSRLMLMKREGIVKQIDHRYIVVHSTQEDNNRDNQGT